MAEDRREHYGWVLVTVSTKLRILHNNSDIKSVTSHVAAPLGKSQKASSSLLSSGAGVPSSVQSGGRFSLGSGIRARLRGRKLDTFRMDLSALSAKCRGLCLPNNRHVYISLPLPLEFVFPPVYVCPSTHSGPSKIWDSRMSIFQFNDEKRQL